MPPVVTLTAMSEWSPVSMEQRVLALDSAVSRASMGGGRLVSRGQTEAVFEYGERPNHVLHAIITIFSCGLWGLVWLIIAATSQIVRRTVVVDEYARAWISSPRGMQEF